MKNLILFLCLQSLFLNCAVAQATDNDKSMNVPKITWSQNQRGVHLVSQYPNSIEDSFHIHNTLLIDVKVDSNKCAVLLNTGIGYRYILFNIENSFQRNYMKHDTPWQILRFEDWPVSSSGTFPAKIALIELKSIYIIVLKELDTNNIYDVTIKSDGSFAKIKD
jgi:hypothetical protein